MKLEIAPKSPKILPDNLGGFNPIEKYARQKWVHLPQIGVKITNI